MMKHSRPFGLDERGMAAVLALVVVLALSLLVAAFLAVSAFEPQISQNLADSMQAHYAADAGIEWAFDQLVRTQDWDTLLAGATNCEPPGFTPAGWANVAIGGLSGAFTVSLRNDCKAGDNQVTGDSGGPDDANHNPILEPPGTATHDANGIVIVTATGSFRGAQKKIQVVIRRPPRFGFPAAVNEPGFQSDTNIVCGAEGGPCANFQIDGRDYACSACTPNADAPWYNIGNWSASGLASKLGITTQLGTQANLDPPATFMQNVENAFTSGTSAQAAQKQSSVSGKDQTTGLAAIGATNALNPEVIQNFLSALTSPTSPYIKNIQILQSTLQCPMRINGDVGGPTSTPTVSNGCGANQTIDLGTPSNPQIVYFRGDLDPTSNFTGVAINNQVQGAGILVVEDGDLKVFGTLNWHGVVIVTGQYVGVGFMDGSTTNINGALVSNETRADEQSGFAELHLGTMSGSATFRYSQQALNLMYMIRKIHTLYGWRTVAN